MEAQPRQVGASEHGRTGNIKSFRQINAYKRG